VAGAGAGPFEPLGAGFATGLTSMGTAVAIGYLIALGVLFSNDRASFAARFRLPPPPS
jgi:F0F1-type ATP synthase membrane subunit c/vacuolar-type H+-ATPase subunit K